MDANALTIVETALPNKNRAIAESIIKTAPSIKFLAFRKKNVKYAYANIPNPIRIKKNN